MELGSSYATRDPNFLLQNLSSIMAILSNVHFQKKKVKIIKTKSLKIGPMPI